MSKPHRDPPSIPISTTVDGRVLRGSYTLQNGIVHVSLHEGRGCSKATQAGESPAEEGAGWLLEELAAEFLAKEKTKH